MARSGRTGSYLLPLLPPGAYTVTVSKSGFLSPVYPSIQVYVTETATLNVRLRVGAVRQKASVSSEASQLQTASSSVGHITDERMMGSLPLVSRNYTQVGSKRPYGEFGSGMGSKASPRLDLQGGPHSWLRGKAHRCTPPLPEPARQRFGLVRRPKEPDQIARPNQAGSPVAAR
jgi:hypothetical protein